MIIRTIKSFFVVTRNPLRSCISLLSLTFLVFLATNNVLEVNAQSVKKEAGIFSEKLIDLAKVNVRQIEEGKRNVQPEDAFWAVILSNSKLLSQAELIDNYETCVTEFTQCNEKIQKELAEISKTVETTNKMHTEICKVSNTLNSYKKWVMTASVGFWGIVASLLGSFVLSLRRDRRGSITK